MRDLAVISTCQEKLSAARGLVPNEQCRQDDPVDGVCITKGFVSEIMELGFCPEYHWHIMKTFSKTLRISVLGSVRIMGTRQGKVTRGCCSNPRDNCDIDQSFVMRCRGKDTCQSGLDTFFVWIVLSREYRRGKWKVEVSLTTQFFLSQLHQKKNGIFWKNSPKQK